MRRTWTIIGVADVPWSFKWYQSLLGLPEAAPAHDYFGQIMDSDGTVLLCLHKWGAHEHPSLTSPYHASLETACSCSSGSTTLTWPCQGRALSSAGWKKSRT